MSNEPVKQITAKELYEDWAIGNPHYEFELDFLSILSKPIKEITLNVVNRGVYCVDLGDFYVDVFADSVVNLYSKPRLFTELQDPSDLDATLPIIPAETAQRDHDRIVQLEAEKAKMRGLLTYIQSLAPDVSAAYYPDREKSLYVDNFKQIGEQIKKMLEGLS